MKKIGGFDKLVRQTMEFVQEELECREAEAPGDSPIEKLLYSALWAHFTFGMTEIEGFQILTSEDQETKRLHLHDEHDLSIPYPRLIMTIRPQAVVNGARVDFLIHVRDISDLPNLRWKRLIVECDGHDFHERTKEQAARDRGKDRRAVLAGVDCFRFTGSEIWRDPWDCADQILQWAIKGWN